MINANKLFLALLASAALAACGGGGTSAPITTLVPTSNASAPVTAKTAAAVTNQPFTFSAGVPDFGTKATPTTVTFTGVGDKPAFAISTGSATATGTTTFGSCIFAVTVSTFPVGSPLAVNQSVRVDPCQLNVATSGGNANGSTNNLPVNFVMGVLNSDPKFLPIVINSDGSTILNGVTIDKVNISVVTGT